MKSKSSTLKIQILWLRHTVNRNFMLPLDPLQKRNKFTAVVLCNKINAELMIEAITAI